MERPPIVRAFGILNLCFGAWRLVRTALTSAFQSHSRDAQALILGRIHAHPEYALWIKWGTPLNLLSCAVLLVTGIGLLRMKEWARKLTIAYGIYSIFLGITGGAMDFAFIVAPSLERMRLHPGNMSVRLIGTVAVVSILRLSILIYPILLLIFMTRPKIVHAFRPSAKPPNLPR